MSVEICLTRHPDWASTMGKSDKQAEHIAALDHALGAIETRYYVSGSTHKPLKLKWAGKTANFPMSLADAQQQLGGLLAAAKQSAFGHKKKTVIDISVRVAQELTAAEFMTDFDPAAAGILEQIRESLVPDAAAVRADLYKLNVMGPGGFFKPHKDTPRGGDTCFGTLVVCLPLPFQGGGLCLKHGHESAHMSWGWNMHLPYGDPSKRAAYVPTKAGLQWAAFFGDVEHEVEKVTEGYRLTLTYTLHRDAAPNPQADILLMRASGFHSALQAALADKNFMPKGGAIGVYCKHLYEEDALAHSEAKLAAGGSNAYAAQLRFKNEDAVVAAVLAAAGLKVQCLRLLSFAEMYDCGPWTLDKMPNEYDARSFGSKQYLDDWQALGVTIEDVGEFCDGTIEDKVGCSVTFLEAWGETKRAWVETWYSSTGYFGNEAETQTFYTTAAMAAVVPPFAQRKRLITAAKRKPLTAQVINPDITSTGTAAAAGAGRGKKRKAGGKARTAAAAAAAAAMSDEDAEMSNDQGYGSEGSEGESEGSEEWQPAKRGRGASSAARKKPAKKQKQKQQSKRKSSSSAPAAAAPGAVPRLFARSPSPPRHEKAVQNFNCSQDPRSDSSGGRGYGGRFSDSEDYSGSDSDMGYGFGRSRYDNLYGPLYW